MMRAGLCVWILLVLTPGCRSVAPNQSAVKSINVIVAADGSGQFTNVQAAIMSVPSGSRTHPVVIHLKPGTYKELIYIQREKRFFKLVGTDEEKIVSERYTTKDTDFRNGQLNLHYLHVNKEKDALTCRACHGDHASNQPKLIRDTARFGSWEIPLQFKKSNTGGSCLAGCHGEYAYNRVNPVQLRAQ